MLKNAVVMFIIAGVMGVVAPHNMQEVGTLTQRLGVTLIELGLLLDPPGYDAGPNDNAPMPNLPQDISSSIDAMRVRRAP